MNSGSPGSSTVFEIYNTAATITVDARSSDFRYCYTGNKGGIFYLETTGTKSVTLIGDTFYYNAAVYGGAVYCDTCTWTI